MTGDDERADTEHDRPRVPGPLRERVDELFVAHRGYEPASFQEALSAVVDLATEPADPEPGSESADGPVDESADGTADGSAGRVSSTGTDSDSTETTVESATEPDADSIDVDPEDASTELEDGSVSFDEYVEGLEETSETPSPAVESILDTEHADGVVRELAAEVLDEMTQDAFEELEHGVDYGVGASVTDGMGATRTADGGTTAPSGTTGDGVPDSLTADPESECAICGRLHRVSVLETAILEEDGSVELVCPSCAE